MIEFDDGVMGERSDTEESENPQMHPVGPEPSILLDETPAPARIASPEPAPHQPAAQPTVRRLMIPSALGAPGLEDGALGIGMPHQYYPGVSYDEIFRLFEFAAEHDAMIFTHVRSMGVAGMQEVVANAVATGAPLHIVHMNSMSLWDYQTNLDMILGAQERGADISVEAYPYTAASTGIASALFDDGWQERMRISYGDIQWQDTGERLTEKTFKKYREQGGTAVRITMPLLKTGT